jgi:hypothetical protein
MIYQHPLAYLLGLEGVALLHAFAGEYDRDFTEVRLAEVRALLDSADQLGGGAAIRPIPIVEGYGAWADARELCLMLASLLVPPAHLSWSALDVGQGLGHPPSPDPQQVNTADMPIRPAVEPPDDNPITRAEHLLNLKMRGWRTGEEDPTRLKHRLPPNVAGPVGCRAGGLEHAVVGDQVTQGVEVPAVERLVEPLNGVASLVIHPQ